MNDSTFLTAESEWLREPDESERCPECGKKKCRCNHDYDETEDLIWE